jgi:hypothetical protein
MTVNGCLVHFMQRYPQSAIEKALAAGRATSWQGKRHFATGKVTVLPFERFCADMEMP